MHIPDGYLSPQTAVPFVIGMIPIMGVAVKSQIQFEKEGSTRTGCRSRLFICHYDV